MTQGGVNPMIQAEEAIRVARGLIGTAYSEQNENKDRAIQRGKLRGL